MGFLGDLFGGGQARAIRHASAAYQQQLQNAMAELRQSRETGRADLTQGFQQALGFGEPYRTAGAGALQAYQGTLGLGGPQAQQTALSSFRQSPGYQFALDQGLRAARGAAAASGRAGSGAEMAELQRLGQGAASQEYGHFQDRLAGLAGMGGQFASQAGQQAMQTGTGLAGLESQFASPLAGLQQGLGQVQGSSILGQQAAHGQFARNIFGGLGSLAGGLLPGLGSVLGGARPMGLSSFL